jgi:hypothetical protein
MVMFIEGTKMKTHAASYFLLEDHENREKNRGLYWDEDNIYF